MKLLNEDLNNSIHFEENKVNILVIENKKYFVEYVEQLLSQINGNFGKFSLFLESKELKISEKIEMIKDIFDLEINNKKMINKIYHELEELSMDSEFLLETKNIESELLKYMYHLSEKYDYPLEICDEINIKELFKIFSIKLSSDFSNKLEEIVEYIKLISEVLKKEVFVLINFYTFFEKEEIIELYKECFYKKIKLLFVENKKPGIINSEEKLFIIDNDLCEINLS